MKTQAPANPAEIADLLRGEAYLADPGLATVLSVALTLGKPLLLEGQAGVGKTECAKTLASVLSTRLIRLQCYEGIDVAHALYDWNYARQMLYIRAIEAEEASSAAAVGDVFGPDFIVRRPLLEAIDHEDESPPVLLIDEIDRADDEFEAFLLELLSDFQVTIPEIGTIRARRRPVVILTSNRTRELHDALRRRCLYHWIDYPSLERELEIVRARLPESHEKLAAQAAAFVASLREENLVKPPGISETLDWVQALCALDQEELSVDVVEPTLGVVLKVEEDVTSVRDDQLEQRVAMARDTSAPRS
ncbi:MAG: MoxR family ATPase [Actinobacteria bacterium]|nr:MoxR family ATPase [Actinomycetota bacterium]